MAVPIRVARRYARSIVGLAMEQKNEARVFEDMHTIANLASRSRDFVVMLDSPVISNDRKVSILKEIFSGKIEELTLNFLVLVAQKSRGEALVSIAKEYIEQYNTAKGIQTVQFTSASALTDEQRNTVKDKLAKATGKSILLEEKIQADLIGGYILRVEDRQLDSSVKSYLNDIKYNFKNS